MVAAAPVESFTCSVNVPAAVGVPVMAPVLVFSVRPPGRVPVTEKVYGAVPPLTAGAGLFRATPTSPELTAGQVSVSAVPMVKGHSGGGCDAVSVLHLERERTGGGGRSGNGAGAGVQRQAAGQSASHRERVGRGSAAHDRGRAVQRYADCARVDRRAGERRRRSYGEGAGGGGRHAVGVLHLESEGSGSRGRSGNGAGAGVQRQAAGQSAGHREGVRRGSAAHHWAGLFNAAPTSPEVTAGQVSVGGRTMVNGQVAAADAPLASFTWSVNVPAAVGRAGNGAGAGVQRQAAGQSAASPRRYRARFRR